MAFAATRMDLGSVIPNEVTQTKEKYQDVSYMWNLKRNGTNELTYKTETHRLKKMNVHLLGGMASQGVWEGYVPLLYSKWITNKDQIV